MGDAGRVRCIVDLAVRRPDLESLDHGFDLDQHGRPVSWRPDAVPGLDPHAPTDLRIGNLFRWIPAASSCTPASPSPVSSTGSACRPLWLTLIWKPIAVLTLFMAVRTYVRRNLVDPVPRIRGDGARVVRPGPDFDLVAHWSRGGPAHYHGMPRDVARALPLGVSLHRSGGRPRPDHPAGLRAARCGRLGLGAPVCGFLCSWLQPWQGATLVAIVLGTEVLLRRREHSASPLLTTVTGRQRHFRSVTTPR